MSPEFHGATGVTVESAGHVGTGQSCCLVLHTVCQSQKLLFVEKLVSASLHSNDTKLASVHLLWPLRSHNKFQGDLGKYGAVCITDNSGHFWEVPVACSSQTAPLHCWAGTPSAPPPLSTVCTLHVSITSVLLEREQRLSPTPASVKVWNEEFRDLLERFRSRIPP